MSTPKRKNDKLMAPVHPGEILREDFMKPLGLRVWYPQQTPDVGAR